MKFQVGGIIFFFATLTSAITTPDPASTSSATPATPNPATPSSATPTQATPSPATPNPATPTPATPNPATPSPGNADLTHLIPITIPTTLSPAQSTALAKAWVSQLRSWVDSPEYTSLSSVLATYSTAVTIVSGSFVTLIPTQVQSALQAEQSALVAVQSKVLSGAAAKETVQANIIGASVALVGILGIIGAL